MTDDRTVSSLQERIRSRIREGSLKPRARFSYSVQIAAAILAALLALLTTLLALSFVFYGVHESGEAFLLGFGWEGIMLFLALFPWALVALALLSLALFQWRLSFVIPSYRVPLLPLFSLLLVLTLGIGYLLVPIHGAVWDRIEDASVPIVGELYESVYESREGYGIFRGRIVSVTEEGIWMVRSDGDADHDDAARFVIVKEDLARFVEGYELFVLGRLEEDGIHALHLVVLPE